MFLHHSNCSFIVALAWPWCVDLMWGYMLLLGVSTVSSLGVYPKRVLSSVSTTRHGLPSSVQSGVWSTALHLTSCMRLYWLTTTATCVGFTYTHRWQHLQLTLTTHPTGGRTVHEEHFEYNLVQWSILIQKYWTMYYSHIICCVVCSCSIRGYNNINITS